MARTIVQEHVPLRYVVLWHTGHGPDHFDLMYEHAPGSPTLVTWRVAPPVGEGETGVESLVPHRRAYLDYEGEVSNGRGSVGRVDAGTCFAGPCDGDDILLTTFDVEDVGERDVVASIRVGFGDDAPDGWLLPVGRLREVAWPRRVRGDPPLVPQR